MAKFHLTPKGQARQCSAQTPESCKYSKDAGETVEHYETKEEAQTAYEKKAQQEFGQTNKITKPKKLTPAQKERAEGRQHALNALANGHDPDRLLKYANTHDAFAKGYTEALKEASQEKAEKDAQEDQAPVAKNEKNNQEAEREIVETTASSIRAGDILHGEKFTNSGRWVDNDAKVVKVETTTDLNWRERIHVTYENGNVAEFTGKAPVSVKRPVGAPEGRDAKELRKDFKTARNELRDNGVLEQETVDKTLKTLNDPNSEHIMALHARKMADTLEENNQHEAAIKIGAAAERIELKFDLNRKVDKTDAFDLIYDEENTDKKVIQKLEKEYPSVADSARKARALREEHKSYQANRNR